MVSSKRYLGVYCIYLFIYREINVSYDQFFRMDPCGGCSVALPHGFSVWIAQPNQCAIYVPNSELRVVVVISFSWDALGQTYSDHCRIPNPWTSYGCQPMWLILLPICPSSRPSFGSTNRTESDRIRTPSSPILISWPASSSPSLPLSAVLILHCHFLSCLLRALSYVHLGSSWHFSDRCPCDVSKCLHVYGSISEILVDVYICPLPLSLSRSFYQDGITETGMLYLEDLDCVFRM